MDALTFDDVPFERDSQNDLPPEVNRTEVPKNVPPREALPTAPQPAPAPAAAGPMSFDDVPYEDGAWNDLAAGWETLKQGFAAQSLYAAESDKEQAKQPFRPGRAAGFVPSPELRRAFADRKINEALADIGESAKELQLRPAGETVDAFNNAKSFTEAFSAFAADPLTIARSTVLRSAPASLPSVVGGIIGSAAGPAGAAVLAGSGSMMTEFGSALADGLQEKGADLEDPESIKKVWAQFGAEITQKAQIRSGIIGVADAATAGIGSKIAAVTGGTWKRELAKEAAGTAVQIVGGMGGELGAQVGTGEKIQPGAILAEGLGEVVSGAAETAGQIGVEKLKAKPKVEVVPDKGPSSEQTVATAAGTASTPNATPSAPAPGVSASVDADAAQAIAGKPVEDNTAPKPKPGEPPAAFAARLAAYKRQQAAATNPTAPAAPQGNSQQADTPAAEAGTEPSTAVGVESTAPPTPESSAAPNDEITANVPNEEVTPEVTTPEAPKTLEIQRAELADPENERIVVQYPKGTKMKNYPKVEGARIERYPSGKYGTFDFDASKITREEISAAAKNGRLNELLGLGPYNKQEVAESAAAGATPVAVTERTPSGTEVKAAAGTEETAPVQVQVLEENKAPENTVQVENPAKVIEERQAAQPKRKIGDLLKPYPGEGYRIGQLSFEFNTRNGNRYLRVRDRSGRNLLQGADGAKPSVDVTDIWNAVDPNTVEPRQGNKVGINSLEANVPEQIAPVLRDWLAGKIDDAEALSRISNTEIGGKKQVANAPSETVAAPKAEQAKATSKAREAQGEAAPAKPRVLEDLSDESKYARELQAEEADVRQAQIKPFLKGRGKIKTLKEADEKTGKNWTPAERTARRKLNEDSEKVVAGFASTPEVSRIERDFMDEDAVKQENARAAIRARAEGMINAAEEAGIALPEKVYGNTDKSMDLGAGAMNLVIAEDFLNALENPYKPVEEHYIDFLSRDMRLRKGLLDEVVSERRTEIDDRMRQAQGGNIEQISTDRVGDTSAEEDTEVSGTMSAAPDESIVGSDDIQVGRPASARMAPQLDDGTQKGELTIKTKSGKTKTVTADVAKPAASNPGRVLSPEEKAAVMREMGLLKRGDAKGSSEPARALRENEILQTKPFTEALDIRGKLRGNKLNKLLVYKILNRMRGQIGDVPVHVVSAKTLREMFPDSRRGVDGYYDPKNNYIVVADRYVATGKFDSQLLAHEGVHAYLQAAINSDEQLNADIQELLDYVKEQAKDKGLYGLKDVQEFIAEAMSNPEFQNFLVQTRVPQAMARKYGKPEQSLWQILIAAIRNHLGLSGKETDALSQVMKLVEKAEQARGKVTSKGNVSASERDAAPIFYSAVQRAIENAKQGKAAAGQWFSTIKGVPGIKDEELDYLDLKNWMESQGRPVTKQELLDYVRANNLQMVEVNYNRDAATADPIITSKDRNALRSWINKNVPEDGQTTAANGNKITNWPREERIWDEESIIDYGDEPSLERIAKAGAPEELLKPYREHVAAMKISTKHSRVTLPGGKNYREMVITLPDNKGEFLHSHWEDLTNAVAHIRFDERTDEFGRKVLFIQEIQSDWHQQARKGGYHDPVKLQKLRDDYDVETKAIYDQLDALKKERDARQDAGIWDSDLDQKSYDDMDVLYKQLAKRDEQFNEDRRQIVSLEQMSKEERDAEIKRLEDEEDAIDGILKEMRTDRSYRREPYKNSGFSVFMKELETYKKQLQKQLSDTRLTPDSVPDAPFKASWPELTLKRIMRYAADNGFDRVAWPSTPEQVAKVEGWDKVNFEKKGERFLVGGKPSSGEKVDVSGMLGYYDLPERARKALVKSDEENPAYMEPGSQATGKDVTPIVKRYTTDMARMADKLFKKFGVKTERTEVTREGSRQGDWEYEGPEYSSGQLDQMNRTGGIPGEFAWTVETIMDEMNEGQSFSNAIQAYPEFAEFLSGKPLNYKSAADTFNSIEVPRQLSDEAQPLFRERNFEQEFKDAGVPDATAKELRDFIEAELGKAIDPDTLDDLIEDLKTQYAANTEAPSKSELNTADEEAKAETEEGLDKLESGLQKAVDSFTPTKGTKLIAPWRLGLTDIAIRADKFFGTKANPVRVISNLVESRRTVKRRILDSILPIVQETRDLEKKYSKGDENRAIWEEYGKLKNDATIAEINPDQPFESHKHLGLSDDAFSKEWNREQYASLVERYNALPDDLKAHFAKERKFYSDVENRRRMAGLKEFFKALGISDDAMVERFFKGKETDADKAKVGVDMARELRRTKEMKETGGPYFPLARQGGWAIEGRYKITLPGNAKRISDTVYEFQTVDEAKAFARKQPVHTRINRVFVDKATGKRFVRDADGKEVRISSKDADAIERFHVTVQNKYFELAESESEAKKITEALRADGLEMSDPTELKNNPAALEGDKLSDQINKLMATAQKRERYSNLSAMEKAAVNQALRETALVLRGASRIQSRQLQRRFVQGASTDSTRNAYDYANQTAGYLAKLETQPQMEAALKDLTIKVRELARRGQGFGGEASRIENVVRDRVLTSDPMRVPTGYETNMNRFASVVFLRYLFSPAYTAFQMTQVPAVTIPELSNQYGAVKTNAYAATVFNDMSLMRTVGRSVLETVKGVVGKGADENTYLDTLKGRLKDQGERDLVDYLAEHGSVGEDSSFEVVRAVRARRGVGGKVDAAIDYMDGMARQGPRAAEAYNRIFSGLLAYRLELAKSGDVELAKTAAQDAVNTTQGNFSLTNRAPIFNNWFGATGLQFAKFGFMYYNLLGRQVGRILRGESVADRLRGVRGLTYHLVAMQLMAGTMGMPWEPLKYGFVLYSALAAVTPLPDFEWDDFEKMLEDSYKDMFGDYADAMLYGPSRLLPEGWAFDTSARIGANSLVLPPDAPTRTKDVPSWLVDFALGAGGSYLGDTTQLKDAIEYGDWKKALQAVFPAAAVVNAFKAAIRYGDGTYSAPDAALRAFGLTSAADFNYNRDNSRQIKEGRDKKDEFNSLYYGYIRAGEDIDRVMQIKMKIIEYNRRQKAIGGKQINIKSAEKKRRQELARKQKYRTDQN